VVEPGAPAITELVAGDQQTAPVGELVPVTPRMRVTDSQGVPVPGVEVTFYVSVGGGEVTGEKTVTGADGTAAVGSWRLGPIPGANELTGEAPGLAPVLFKAVATASADGSMEILDGNHQYAPVGQAVGVAPAVVLRDGGGAPVAGQTVSFEVVSGGGSVAGGTATSDAQGVARVGSWTLGGSAGLNELAAKIQGKPTVVFRATGVAQGDPTLDRQVLLGGLAHPWDITFAPDGTMLYTERGGRLWALRPGQSEPVEVMKPPSDLNPQSQSGLLGVALDKDFASNRIAYLYVSSNLSGSMDNRVRKVQIGENYSGVTVLGDILTGIPWGSGGGHSGGRLRLGPDGFLYVTTGDNRAATIPQDLKGLGSKVLRITTDGQPAPGNPDLGPGTRREIFAYGFRNPQGIAFRPGSGQVFLCEHGPNQDDEVTLLKPGGNGGWDPNDGNGNYNGYSGAKMTDTQKFPGALPPTLVVSDSQGMGGCDFLQGTGWKSYDGRLAVAMLAGRRLISGRPSSDGSKMEVVSNDLQNIARLRAVTMGPDGNVYIAVDEPAPNGQIWRVSPK
jgi:glucose/arabinose dehydrogenase